MKSLGSAAGLCVLCGCATVQPDHYYILTSQPQAAPQPQAATDGRTEPATKVSLRVSLPSLVDRPEMVLNTTADAITVLEHERWGAPLADLVAQTLAEDIERRRADLLVSGHSAGSGGAAVKVVVDIVQVAVRRGRQASIDVHWVIVNASTGSDLSGGGTFNAPMGDDSYAAVARALSDCLGLLADRLVGQMRPPQTSSERSTPGLPQA